MIIIQGIEHGTQHEVAEACKISVQRVRQLVQQDIIPQCSPGRYPIADSVKRYRAYQETITQGNQKKKHDDTITASDDKRRKMAADANLAELKYMEKAGTLVNAESLAQAWAQAGASIRERILQSAERIITRLTPHVSDPTTLDAVVYEEIESALRAISDEPPHE